MAIYIMPGEDKLFSITLPDKISTVTAITVKFQHADKSTVVSYTDTNTDNIFTLDSDGYTLWVFVPSAKTYDFHDDEKAYIWLEWTSGGYKKIPRRRINVACGHNYNRPGVTG